MTADSVRAFEEPSESGAADTACVWFATLSMTGGADTTYADLIGGILEVSDTLNTVLESMEVEEDQILVLFGSNRLRPDRPLETGERRSIPRGRVFTVRVQAAYPDGERQQAAAHLPCGNAEIDVLRESGG